MPVTFSKSNYYEGKILSATFNNIPWSIANSYIGLYTGSPSKSGGGTEVVGSGYARQILVPVLSGGNLVFNPQDSTGSTISFATVTFPVVTGSSYTVVAVGIFDAVSGANMLMYQTEAATIIPVGQVATFANGNLTVLES